MKTTSLIFDLGGVLFPKQPWMGVRPDTEKFQQIKQLVVDIYRSREVTINKHEYSPKDFKIDLIANNYYSFSSLELNQIYKFIIHIDQPLFERVIALSKITKSMD